MLTMSYRGQLEIKFHPGAFSSKSAVSAEEKANLPIELTFAKGKATSPIASLVLQSLQQHLATVQQPKIAPSTLLRFISTAWDRSISLENEARMLEFCGVTRLTLSSPKDNKSLSLCARCTLLGNTTVSSTPGRKGAAAKNEAKRIDVDFTVRTRIKHDNNDTQDIGYMDFDIDALASKVYGFGSGNKVGLPVVEMQSILGKNLSLEEGEALGNGVWCKAVQKLTGSVF